MCNKYKDALLDIKIIIEALNKYIDCLIEDNIKKEKEEKETLLSILKKTDKLERIIKEMQ